MKLTILTRCTRTENLLKIRDSIFNVPSHWNITWQILFDISVINKIDADLLGQLKNDRTHFHFWKGVPGDMGHGLLNKALDSIEDDNWVYILDDDNILHEDFLNDTWSAVIDNGPDNLDQDYKHLGLIFNQYVGGKDFSGLEIREASPENVCVSKVDMAQFLLRRDLIGDTRFVSNTYVADGIFIESIYKKNSEKILFMNNVICYYNYLQTSSTKQYSLPRILVVGEKIDEIRSIKRANYESDELYLVNPDKESIVQAIHDHDPDCLVSIGKDFNEFPQLCKLSYDFRQRWIHTIDDENLGEVAYNCAMHSMLNPNTSDLVSIFTPVYNTGEKIRRTYESIKNQQHRNWEWVIVNDSTDSVTGKIVESIAAVDPRIRVYEFCSKTKGIIGESKYRACVLCRGDFLLELDHDDYLTPDALSLLLDASRLYPDAGFFYSDCAEIDENYNSLTYGEGFALGYGKYREETHFNRNFKVAIAPNINPLTIRHIVGVPNHFRAWRRDAYFKAGCHNRRLSIADDYELIVRTFLTTDMVKIQRCCYLQFFHGSNSQDATRADIQRRVRSIANNYNEKIKIRFEELGKIDWAYSSTGPSVMTPPRFGEDERYVNSIYDKISN